MRKFSFAGALLAASLPAIALADVDLSGAWQAPSPSKKQAPASAVFSGKNDLGAKDAYHLAFTNGVVTRNLEAVWDGSVLRIVSTSSSTTGPGVIGSLAPDPFAGGVVTSAKVATYELESAGALEKLVLTAGAIPDLPKELRRPKAPDVRAPAEWEQAEEILWGYRNAFAVSRIYAASVKSTANESVKHVIYVGGNADKEQLEYEFAEQSVPVTKLRFVTKSFQTVWMRDYGPITLKKNSDGSRIVGDMGYFWDRKKDDSIPAQYAKERGWERRDVESLKLEGGNYMTDGKGRVFTTNRALEANGTQTHIETKLRDLGGKELLFFERMPEPEGTGHIDMFAKLVDEKTVLVGRCDDNAKFRDVLDRNAEKFAKLGYKVIRLDMASGTKLMTYTNSLFVGKTVLIPTYNHARDKAALEAYRKLGWKPVGIDARTVIKANGAIHCISMQIPK